MTSLPEENANDLQSAHTALIRVYQEHITTIYRFLYSRVGNREDAEDLTSQVFLKAVSLLDSSRDELSVKSWLFQLAKTTLADHWRQYYKSPKVPLHLVADSWQEPTQEPPSLRPPETLRQVLDQLPDNYRRVLTLRFLEGLSIKEAAAEMGVSEGNVKVLQLRALRRAAERGAHLL